MPDVIRYGWPVVLCIVLAGCLPSSCRRDPPRELFAADSLSRSIAEQTPEDTLRQVWQVSTDEVPRLQHPRTVRFGPGGWLYVADTERHSVFVFDSTGAPVQELAPPTFRYPYLAGFRGDTLLVFNPEAGYIDFVVNGASARQIQTPADLPGANAFQYVAASDSTLFFKALAEGTTGYVARLDDQGQIAEREALAGPYWRYAGQLRTWGDSLLSLSGYRPLVDVFVPGQGLDSLALTGFDSPMLARSRSFLLGEIEEPPLLSASAAPAGDLLFVLNMRPGWLRVDVYGRDGRLQHILIQQDPAFNQNYYPLDLDVRRNADGSYDLTVITSDPEPTVTVYRWLHIATSAAR
jgi:hypothetical protein